MVHRGFGNKASVTYSDGYAVNGITTDLEGNQSAETDMVQGSSPYSGTHTSMSRRFSMRDEVAFEGPVTPNGLLTMTEYANGIQLPTDAQSYSSGPPIRGGPLRQLTSTPSAPLNALDGFEGSSSGSYSSNTVGTDYTNTVVYDAAGRLKSSDSQQCSLDSADQQSLSSWSETLTAATYDAENHTTSQELDGTQGVNSTIGPCSWPQMPSATANYAISWGTSGHPIQLTITTSTVVHEYLHWDGDTLLYTSTAPGAGADDVKIGGFAEMTISDGNIAVYDRDSGGTTVDAHTTSWSTPNISYNDVFDPIGKMPVLALCYAYGMRAPCIVITQPKPENLAGYAGFSVQGVRGVDSSLGHWTTPDALLSTGGDPASQLPYMYSGNNPYKYSDPTGYRIEWRGGSSEEKKTALDLYNKAIDYFTSKEDYESAAFLRMVRDDPSFTVLGYVSNTGAGPDDSGMSNQGAFFHWDASSGLSLGDKNHVQSPALGLLHEVDHAFRHATDEAGLQKDVRTKDGRYRNREERRVVEGRESAAARMLGEPVRSGYYGTPCIVRAPVTGTSC